MKRKQLPGDRDLPDLRNAAQLASYLKIERRRREVILQMVDEALEEDFRARVRGNIVNRIAKSMGH